MTEYTVEHSTTINKIGHEEPTLRVFFERGTIIDYPDVSVELAEGLSKSQEPGRFFVDKILPDRKGRAVKHERAPYTFTVQGS